MRTAVFFASTMLVLLGVLAPPVLANPTSCVVVDVPAQDDTVRVGNQPFVQFQFQVCDSEPVSGLLSVSVDGILQSTVPIGSIPAGGFVSSAFTTPCVQVGVRQVVFSLAVARIGDPQCVAVAADTALVHCVCTPPDIAVDKASPDTSIGIGENINVPFQFKNKDTEELSVVLDCFVDGQSTGSVPVPSWSAGSFLSTTVPFLCDDPGPHEVVCRLTGKLPGDLNSVCTTVVADTAIVECGCIEPAVSISAPAPDDTIGVGQQASVAFNFQNEDSRTLDLLLECFVDGQSVGSVPIPGVLPSAFVSTAIPVTCDQVGVREVVCRMTGYVPGDINMLCTTVQADTAYITCGPLEACPQSAGFWRQQCSQRGRRIVCKGAMESLWRCAIEKTGVTHWIDGDGQQVATADLAMLSNAALFDAMCSELRGSTPMTLRQIAEIQYLTLLLNICSGALPDYIEHTGDFTGSVGAIVDSLENSLNAGMNLAFWKTVADSVNKNLDLTADECPAGIDLFRDLGPCGGPQAVNFVETGVEPRGLQLRAFPNPVPGTKVSILFRVPEGGSRQVEVGVFDVTGRLVRRLVQEDLDPGEHSVSWDLRNDGGSRVPSGVYFYRVQAGSHALSRKLMVVMR